MELNFACNDDSYVSVVMYKPKSPVNNKEFVHAIDDEQVISITSMEQSHEQVSIYFYFKFGKYIQPSHIDNNELLMIYLYHFNKPYFILNNF